MAMDVGPRSDTIFLPPEQQILFFQTAVMLLSCYPFHSVSSVLGISQLVPKQSFSCEENAQKRRRRSGKEQRKRTHQKKTGQGCKTHQRFEIDVFVMKTNKQTNKNKQKIK